MCRIVMAEKMYSAEVDFEARRRTGHGRCAVKLHQHRLCELLPGDSRRLGDLLGCIGGGMADGNSGNRGISAMKWGLSHIYPSRASEGHYGCS
ncbi:uncharacterized protein Dmul_08770 [Desulfococcus multivorans]|nr:uncharacterized protein Dmul_08770 [Desulfococcus multivorans]